MKRNSLLKTSTLLKGIAVIPALALVLLSVSVNAQKRPAPPVPKAPVSAAQSKNKIYNVVEVLPKFPGGVNALGKFLSKNIKYPAADREHNLSGKVIAQFVVKADGGLDDIKVLRSPSELMSAEAMRVLSLSPKWKPGKQNGKAVAAYYTIPINFTLSDI